MVSPINKTLKTSCDDQNMEILENKNVAPLINIGTKEISTTHFDDSTMEITETKNMTFPVNKTLISFSNNQNMEISENKNINSPTTKEISMTASDGQNMEILEAQNVIILPKDQTMEILENKNALSLPDDQTKELPEIQPLHDQIIEISKNKNIASPVNKEVSTTEAEYSTLISKEMYSSPTMVILNEKGDTKIELSKDSKEDYLGDYLEKLDAKNKELVKNKKMKEKTKEDVRIDEIDEAIRKVYKERKLLSNNNNKIENHDENIAKIENIKIKFKNDMHEQKEKIIENEPKPPQLLNKLIDNTVSELMNDLYQGQKFPGTNNNMMLIDEQYEENGDDDKKLLFQSNNKIKVENDNMQSLKNDKIMNLEVNKSSILKQEEEEIIKSVQNSTSFVKDSLMEEKENEQKIEEQNSSPIKNFLTLSQFTDTLFNEPFSANEANEIENFNEDLFFSPEKIGEELINVENEISTDVKIEKSLQRISIDKTQVTSNNRNFENEVLPKTKDKIENSTMIEHPTNIENLQFVCENNVMVESVPKNENEIEIMQEAHFASLENPEENENPQSVQINKMETENEVCEPVQKIICTETMKNSNPEEDLVFLNAKNENNFSMEIENQDSFQKQQNIFIDENETETSDTPRIKNNIPILGESQNKTETKKTQSLKSIESFETNIEILKPIESETNQSHVVVNKEDLMDKIENQINEGNQSPNKMNVKNISDKRYNIKINNSSMESGPYEESNIEHEESICNKSEKTMENL